ncbi:MAG: transporter substrate-binding domain-containing protein [Campylobacteraceae bacterium]|nr:transporter substrate-binding domain-containing protein [Campylobacteraceae bacterium]
MKIILLYIFVFFLSNNSFANESVDLAIGEWAPYTSQKDKKGKITEIIVKEAFKLENIDVKYRYYPWKRSFLNVKAGLATGTFPWYYSEENERDFIMSKEFLINVKTVFFHLKSLDFHWENYEDLKKYTIGGTIGYTETMLLKDEGLNVQLVPREELNFKKMLKHRIDITASSIVVGTQLINKIFTKENRTLFTYHPKVLLDSKMYMLISRKIPNAQKIADSFDRGLKRLKKSGRYDKIIATFLSK